MKSIIVGTKDYQQLLKPFGEVTHYHSGLLNKLQDYDTIMFTGGADVNPLRYGEKVFNHATHTHNTRDAIEFDLFTLGKRLGKKFIGVCRGAQLLCVANGDRLIQNVDNHLNRTHGINTLDGRLIPVIGDHHQMMAPDNGLVVAFSKGLSTYYEDGMGKATPFKREGEVIEPEAVYYEISSSLGVQFHPEWAGETHPSRHYFNELVEEYIL